jgi:hypothetical protein
MDDVRNGPSLSSPATATHESPAWRYLIDTPWLLLLTLFFVTAAIGLPLLWMSRGFSTLAKCFWTIAVVLWTALVLWVFWLIMAWCLPRIWEGIQALSSQQV